MARGMFNSRAATVLLSLGLVFGVAGSAAAQKDGAARRSAGGGSSGFTLFQVRFHLGFGITGISSDVSYSRASLRRSGEYTPGSSGPTVDELDSDPVFTQNQPDFGALLGFPAAVELRLAGIFTAEAGVTLGFVTDGNPGSVQGRSSTADGTISWLRVGLRTPALRVGKTAAWLSLGPDVGRMAASSISRDVPFCVGFCGFGEWQLMDGDFIGGTLELELQRSSRRAAGLAVSLRRYEEQSDYGTTLDVKGFFGLRLF
ncbi:MAG: hypothetical protein ACE5FJ_07835 [Gemmatimonadales bacterium]